MKPEGKIYWLLGIEAFAIGVMVFFAWDLLTKNTKDLFEAALVLLAFVSIFYTLVISGGHDILRKVRTKLEEKQKAEVTQALKEIPNGADAYDVYSKVDEMRDKAQQIMQVCEYLKFNKWLFLTVMAYLISITCYLFQNSWATWVQIISFWAGLTLTFFIVTAWFAINELHERLIGGRAGGALSAKKRNSIKKGRK